MQLDLLLNYFMCRSGTGTLEKLYLFVGCWVAFETRHVRNTMRWVWGRWCLAVDTLAGGVTFAFVFRRVVVSGAAATVRLTVRSFWVIVLYWDVRLVADRWVSLYLCGDVGRGVLTTYLRSVSGGTDSRAASRGRYCRLPSVGRGFIGHVFVSVVVMRVGSRSGMLSCWARTCRCFVGTGSW